MKIERESQPDLAQTDCDGPAGYLFLFDEGRRIMVNLRNVSLIEETVFKDEPDLVVRIRMVDGPHIVLKGGDAEHFWRVFGASG